MIVAALPGIVMLVSGAACLGGAVAARNRVGIAAAAVMLTAMFDLTVSHFVPALIWALLLASAGAPVAQRAPLEVPDAPCWVLLSGSGLVARTDSLGELSPDGRSAHDVVVAKVRTTAQGEFGVLTNRGRLLRCPAIELHTVPLTASAPSLQGGSLAHELWPLEPGECPLGLTTL